MKGRIGKDHDYCVVDEVVKLMDKGFTCYLDIWVPIYPGCSGLRRMRYQPDIYAVKGSEKVLVEVGGLSQRRKLQELKELEPTARIIRVRQWHSYNFRACLK